MRDKEVTGRCSVKRLVTPLAKSHVVAVVIANANGWWWRITMMTMVTMMTFMTMMAMVAMVTMRAMLRMMASGSLWGFN